MEAHVWVARSDEPSYAAGTVLDAGDEDLVVALDNDAVVHVPAAAVFSRNSPDAEASEDLAELPHLNEPCIVHALRLRHSTDAIYTNVGSILVAVNPFRRIDGLYDTDKMAACRGKKLWNAGCGPHVFAISEQAYATMKKLRKNQCIVVSGESGAGKTETNRQLMNYLVWRGTDSESEDTLTKKIMDTNPILEAFGNAKTTRNNNSSRFGR